MQKCKGFPVHLTPFQMSENLNSKISKALRVKGKIAGWCILHNIGQDTAQCSALYIKDEYRGKNTSMKLIASSAIDTQNKNIKYVIYQAKYRDRNLIEYLSKLTENDAVAMKYHTLVSRKYYTETHEN